MVGIRERANRSRWPSAHRHRQGARRQLGMARQRQGQAVTRRLYRHGANWAPDLVRAAHIAVNRARERGDLVAPAACEACGLSLPRLHAHHDDYMAPLGVRWLCAACHAAWHRPAREDRDPHHVQVGQRIAGARRAVGVSCATLATRAGLSRGTVARLERGQGAPCLATLMKLATALDVSHQWLWRPS